MDECEACAAHVERWPRRFPQAAKGSSLRFRFRLELRLCCPVATAKRRSIMAESSRQKRIAGRVRLMLSPSGSIPNWHFAEPLARPRLSISEGARSNIILCYSFASAAC
jgi:hypothetical protein